MRKAITSIKTFTLIAGLVMATQAGAETTREVLIDGAVGKLAAKVQLPVNKGTDKVPIVVLCHGFGGDMEAPVLTDIARNLLESGIGVVRFDFNGHGKSEGELKGMTVLNEIEDLKKVLTWTEAQGFASTISLAGHSQGGVVAAMVAGEYGFPRIESLGLLAAAAVLRDDALRGSVFGTQYDPWNIPESVTIGGGKTIGGEYFRIAQTLPIYETSFNYTGPVFILQGTHDSIVPYTYAERFNDGYAMSELRLVPEEDHGFTKFTSEDALYVSDFFTKRLK